MNPPVNKDYNANFDHMFILVDIYTIYIKVIVCYSMAYNNKYT